MSEQTPGEQKTPSENKKKRDRFTPRRTLINGKPFWQVAMGSEVRDGKRVRLRRTFASHTEAETFAGLKRIERRNRGTQSVALTEKQRTNLLEAETLLSPYPSADFLDIIREWVRHRQLVDKSETVSNAVEALLLAKQSDGASKRYLDDLRLRLRRFSETFGERKLADLGPDEIADWLRALGQAPLSRNTFHLRISALYSFGRERRWVDKNPMTDVPMAKVVSGEVGILAPEQMARLLESADEATLPFWAIGGFAGLRTAELMRLQWEQVDFEAGLIEITAKSSKTASRRLVRIEPCLHKWISPYMFQHGPVCPDGLSKRLLKDRKHAGLQEWPSNALRHSFASYHLAHFGNPQKTSAELGHMNAAVVFQHYRNLVRPEQAERWWKIVPVVTGKLITGAVA
jgi:integrase